MTSPVPSIPTVAVPSAQRSVPPAARAEEVWRSQGSDDPDLLIVWHEPTQYDGDRGIFTADVVARYPEAENIIAGLAWFPSEAEQHRFYLTGHGASEPVAFPEDTTAVAMWAHGYLSAANAMGGWSAFAAGIEDREDHEATDWADEAARNPYL
ncbi:hypothetical protein ACIQVK_18855 [Streptomyces sp. NPDC090493]|uniref:hypothetical protein n=1 Tax=Streptomyces sp. NPDC090493 TaxID=3365964 RepID=UPI0038245028